MPDAYPSEEPWDDGSHPDLTWPVVRRYTGGARARVAMPVGGVGTGCVSLGGRGQLLDWELFNRQAKGFAPDSFFCLRVADEDGRAVTRVLESELLDHEYAGPHGSPSPMHGLPRFRHGEFAAAYPFGQVRLADPELPVEAVLQVYNPLVPGDADASGLPAVIYRVRVRNTSGAPVEVAVCGSLQHIAGRHRDTGIPDGNTYRVEHTPHGTVLTGGCGDRVARDDEAWGTLALATAGERADSHRLTWARRAWGDSLLDFWDDFGADGRLDGPEHGTRVPTGSLVATRRIAPGAAEDITFVIAWHFPNRRAWSRHGHTGSETVVGNHYTGRFADAADVVGHLVPRLPEYEARTLAYVGTVAGSDLPTAVKDAVLSNAAVLKTPTCFRIADGTFLAWEGGNPDDGSCHGSCTHVWNYQYALEQLFPDLAWSMREVEFTHSLDERGLMHFRAGLPLATRGTEWGIAAADGQMGTILRFYRTWQLTGDDARLAAYWPKVRRAMEFAWIPLGWDADRDGVMEGCQHSTSDVEYYGPSGVNQSWYLGALAACVELARAAGDDAFAETCAEVLRSGAAGTDAEVFNGAYYAQHVRPALSADRIAEGLRIRHVEDTLHNGSDDLVDPDLQIGPGCMSDQLAGHALAVHCGLDDGLDRPHVSTALDSVLRHNHRGDFYGHFNHLRTYALGAEHGLLNCSYPRGGRPESPFPYCNEVWTGLEYTFALTLTAHGRREEAAHLVEDARGRYDGRRRNPFNEVECGDHYVRSMASFGLAHAWPRTVVDARARVVTIEPLPGRWPVVCGDTVGTVEVEQGPGGATATATGALDAAGYTVRLRRRGATGPETA
ncbi:GH116 family glycosyl-hydrolase [Streptomyces sp. NPDC050560]|uniref:GH116 family glycosyl-hydrolase n=1 Tax=Streptomyces sp. NPDC050560 TaxID=3365630 RepID=UPI003793FD8C